MNGRIREVVSLKEVQQRAEARYRQKHGDTVAVTPDALAAERRAVLDAVRSMGHVVEGDSVGYSGPEEK